jgi:hypothetical protein
LRIAEAARDLVLAGYAVYPANPETKSPLISKWNGVGAMTDPAVAERRFEREFCGAAVGIACGPSRILVLDVDPRNGGSATWRKLCTEIGLHTLDGSITVATPGGGFHIYFEADDLELVGGAHALGRGVDVLARGQGALAPPSSRSVGRYEARTASGRLEGRPRQLPAVLIERIRRRIIDRVEANVPDVFRDGERNVLLTRFAGKLRRAGANAMEICAALQRANETRCNPILEEAEVMAIAQSVSRYAPERDGFGWLIAWRSQPMTPQELRVALFLGTLAECVAGPLSPSSEFASRETGLAANHYHAARKRLHERGAIVVHNRGRKAAPIIELRFPQRGVTTQGNNSFPFFGFARYSRLAYSGELPENRKLWETSN